MDGELKTIVPGPVQGDLTHVWIVAKQWRDWLTQAEGEQLTSVMTSFNWDDAQERVRRARSRIDQVFRAYYADQRTASLVSGFESLLKVDAPIVNGKRKPARATAQFKLRVPALAKMVGSAITPDEAANLYDDRSVYVHGGTQNYTELTDELIERYERFESVLRSAILRASTDAAFGQLFSSDEEITKAFGALPKK